MCVRVCVCVLYVFVCTRVWYYSCVVAAVPVVAADGTAVIAILILQPQAVVRASPLVRKTAAQHCCPKYYVTRVRKPQTCSLLRCHGIADGSLPLMVLLLLLF